MEQKRLLADNPVVGKARQKVYAHVLNRIKMSIEAGFYLEAVTLEESFITDRLDSFMNASGYNMKKCGSFGNKLKAIEEDPKGFNVDLALRTKAWKDERNKSLHGMAKFSSLEEADWFKKVEACGKCADEGQKIARKIDAEVLRIRRLNIRAEKSK